MPEVVKIYSPLMSNFLNLADKTNNNQFSIVCKSFAEYYQLTKLLRNELNLDMVNISNLLDDPLQKGVFPHAIAVSIGKTNQLDEDKITFDYESIKKMSHHYANKQINAETNIASHYYQTDTLTKLKLIFLRLWIILSSVFIVGVAGLSLYTSPRVGINNIWVVTLTWLGFCELYAHLYNKSSDTSHANGLIPNRYYKPIWYWFMLYLLADIAVLIILVIDFNCNLKLVFSIEMLILGIVLWLPLALINNKLSSLNSLSN